MQCSFNFYRPINFKASISDKDIDDFKNAKQYYRLLFDDYIGNPIPYREWA